MSLAFSFYRPPRIRFGPGEFNNVAREVDALGKRVLVVTGKNSLNESGGMERLVSSLDKLSLHYSMVETEGEPSPDFVDSVVTEFKNSGISAVLGIGGGSSMDAGKAISAMLLCDGSVSDYLEGVGEREHPGSKVPFVAVPTTSGTGSEATKNAVLSSPGPDGFKKSLRHDNLVPDLVLIDPELTLSCPREISAACGMDAFSQLLESYVSTKASPITDALALDGLERVVDNLLLVCSTGATDVQARAQVAYASFISGITLANAGLGVVHGIAGPLGGLFSIPHGVACGTLLGPAIKVTIDKMRKDPERHGVSLEKFASVGKLFSRRSTDDIDQSCKETVDGIYRLTEKLELPCLSGFGITAADCGRIVERSGNKNNPVPLDPDEIRQVLKERIAS